MELDGARLHVAHWPDPFAVLRKTAADRWLTIAELRTLIQKAISTPASPAPTSPVASAQPTVTPPKAEPEIQTQNDVGTAIRVPAPYKKSARPVPDLSEMAIRVKKLRSLGNTPMQIRTMLTQTETEPERIQAILETVNQVERQEQARQRKKLRLSLSIVGIMVVIFVGAGIILQKVYSSKQTQIASSLQATLVPDLAKILKLDTPVVRHSVAPAGSTSGSVTGCPRTPEEAAALFGGQPEKWSSPQGSNGWIMINIGQATTIYVPTGMKAAYLQLGNNVQLVEVLGPATLSNVYYLAVSCP